ncbi:MAG: hypothetical protein ACOVO2_04610 [Emticicia sp.]
MIRHSVVLKLKSDIISAEKQVFFEAVVNSLLFLTCKNVKS